MGKLTVKAMRVNRHFTQQEIADKMSEYVEMNVRMYSERENGTTKWSAIEIAAFAKVTGYENILEYDLG